MFKNRRKGFTLIELLVVIAIIGILSSIVLASLNTARAKARDAQRISDVKQLALLLQMENDADPGATVQTCVLADALTTLCDGPGDIIQFDKFSDPSTPGTECTSLSTATCGYSISQADGTAAATTNDWQICFYLEKTAPGYTPAGLHSLTSPIGEHAVSCL